MAAVAVGFCGVFFGWRVLSMAESILDSSTLLLSSRGGGVVIALASRSKFAQWASQPVGLWLAGVRVPSPAPFCYLEPKNSFDNALGNLSSKKYFC